MVSRPWDFNSEISHRVASIKHIILSLYKLPLRKPAPVDRLKGRSGHDTSLYQHFDILYVKDKFPGVDDSLAKRLGKLISRRRQLLEYRVTHTDRLRAPAAQQLVTKPAPAVQELHPALGIPQNTEPQSRDEGLIQTRFNPSPNEGQSSRTKTSVLRFDQAIISGTALYAPSIAESRQSAMSEYTSSHKIRIPPRPVGKSGQPLAQFECPFCGLSKYIPLESDRGWE